MCRIRGEKVNESPSGLPTTEGRKLGAIQRPSITEPKLPERLTLASREKKVSLAKRPWLPVSTLMNEVSWKLALRPPPRSSVPLKPNQDVVRPPLSTTDLRPASPEFLMEPANTSTRPDTSTELWAWAPPAHSSTPPSERDSANRFFFMGSPGLGRVVNKVKNECLGSCAIALSAAVALPMAAWWRTSLACQKAEQVLCPGFAPPAVASCHLWPQGVAPQEGAMR